MIKYHSIRVIIASIVILASGCKSDKSQEKLVIAEQFGLAYAQIEIMKHNGTLEQKLAEEGVTSVEIVWQKMANTTAMREAMLAGQVDICCVAIPPCWIA